MLLPEIAVERVGELSTLQIGLALLTVDIRFRRTIDIQGSKWRFAGSRTTSENKSPQGKRS